MLGVMVDIIHVCLIIYNICLIYAYYDACGAPRLEHVMSMQKRRKRRRQNDNKDEDEDAEQARAGAETMAWAQCRRGMSEP